MRRIVIGASALALAVGTGAAPASAAAGPDIPPVNCGIVSCTYFIEKRIEDANAATEGVRECVENGIGALQNWLQGTPQPGVCNP